MKIDLAKCEAYKDFSLKMEGQEDWLESIYKNFPTPQSCVKPLLTASLVYKMHNKDLGEIKVSLQYTPYVNCSRCNKKIPWCVVEDVTYSLVSSEARQEMGLANTLDQSIYFFKDRVLDIVPMLQELVYLAIPSRTILVNKDSDTCGICSEEISSSRVFSTATTSDNLAPFSELKNFFSSSKNSSKKN